MVVVVEHIVCLCDLMRVDIVRSYQVFCKIERCVIQKTQGPVVEWSEERPPSTGEIRQLALREQRYDPLPCFGTHVRRCLLEYEPNYLPSTILEVQIWVVTTHIAGRSSCVVGREI